MIMRACAELPMGISAVRLKEELGDKAVYGATMRRVDYTYGDFRARREASVWRRLNRILLVLLIIAIWLVIVSLFVPPYKKLMRSRAEIDNLLIAGGLHTKEFAPAGRLDLACIADAAAVAGVRPDAVAVRFNW